MALTGVSGADQLLNLDSGGLHTYIGRRARSNRQPCTTTDWTGADGDRDNVHKGIIRL